MNWGYKILVVIIVFVVGMMTMVYISMQQTNDMLDENYYVQEKKYQSLIDAQAALKKIQTTPLLEQDEQVVKIQMPASSYENAKDASIQFLKPDNQKLDVEMAFEPNDSGQYSISKSQLVKGVYKVRVKWSNEGTLYYSDDNFYVM